MKKNMKSKLVMGLAIVASTFSIMSAVNAESASPSVDTEVLSQTSGNQESEVTPQGYRQKIVDGTPGSLQYDSKAMKLYYKGDGYMFWDQIPNTLWYNYDGWSGELQKDGYRFVDSPKNEWWEVYYRGYVRSYDDR